MAQKPEFAERVNEHVAAVSGHVNIVAFLNNGSPEDEKTKLVVECLCAFRQGDFSNLKRRTSPGAEIAQALNLPTPAEEPASDIETFIEPEDDMEEEVIEEGEEMNGVADVAPQPMEKTNHHPARAAAEEDDVQRSLRLLGQALAKPKKAEIDEDRVKQIVADRYSEVLQEVDDKLQRQGGSFDQVNQRLDHQNAAIKTLEGLISTVDKTQIQSMVVDALQSSVGQKISDGLKAGTLELLPAMRPVDTTYVRNAVSHKLERAIKSRHHVIVSGPSGSGKSYPIEQELRRAGIRYIGPISMGSGMTKKDLLAREWLKATDKGVVTEWVYGFLVRAMNLGCPLIIDEISQMEKETLTHMYHAMEYGVLNLQETDKEPPREGCLPC